MLFCLLFNPFFLHRVFEALQAADARSSAGEDKLDPFFLRLSAPLMTEQSTHIFNLSYWMGIYMFGNWAL